MVKRESTIIFITIIFFIFTGCGKEGEKIEKFTAREGKVTALYQPEVISAKILPEMATKMSGLQVIVEGKMLDQKGAVLLYQWRRNGQDIEGATKSHLSPDNFSKGDEISVIITPVLKGKKGITFETRPVIVQNSPPKIKGITLIPDVIFKGSHIKVKVDAVDADGDEIFFTYHWIVNGMELPDEKEEIFAGNNLKRGDKVAIKVVPSDGEMEGEPLISKTLIVQNSPPKIHSSPPTVLKEGGFYQYNVHATDPDGDSIYFSIGPSAPPGMTIGARNGIIQWQVPAGILSGEYRIEIFADDGNGGKSVQRYTLIVGTR